MSTLPTVADVMQREPITVPASASVEDAAREMATRRFSSLLVVDETRNIVGIITERDAVRAIAAGGGASLAACTVRDIMSSPVRSVVETTPLDEAIAELQRAGVRRLLVVDAAGRNVGLATQTDLLRAALGRLETEQQRLSHQVDMATEQLAQANARLQLLAREDGLLGIGNRRAMEEALSHEHALGVRHGRPWAVVLVDVDHFKKYNDRYGHLAGDDALKRVCGALGRCVRASDHVYRYGGEEFLVVLAETDLGGAAGFARRAVESVGAERILHQDSPVGVLTVSVGVSGSELAPKATDWQAVARFADEALYRAKDAGRNRWVLGTAEETHTGSDLPS